MDNLTNNEQEQPENDDDEPDMTQLINAITNVPTMIQRNTQKHKLLQTQMSTWKGQRQSYNEFEYLLLNQTRPFRNKITEEEKLHFFTSHLHDANEFWRTVRVTRYHTQGGPTDVP